VTRPRPTDHALLEAGRRAVTRLGVQGATLERIAEEAGVSRTTLHRRGIGRETILARLGEEAVEAYRRALWPALTSPGTAQEQLETALAALCDVAEENLELLLALGAHTDAVFHDDSDDERLTRSPFTDPLERLLRDGATDGTLRTVEPTEYATVLFNLVGWTYIHLRARHGWRPQRARAATLDVALHGVVT
jgi:AcrR family transcriptional regulator